MSEIRTPSRRLAALNPRWLSNVNDPASDRYGVEFDCPCGGADCPFARPAIMFANPVAGPPSRWGQQKWQRTGDTFDALTLEPSLHMVGHWHGWLRNGVLESC